MENLNCWFLQLKEVGREPCQVGTPDLIFCYLSLRVPAVPAVSAEQALSCSTLMTPMAAILTSCIVAFSRLASMS